MNQLLIVLSILASIGIITNLGVNSAIAWHAEFPNIKECRKAVIDTTGNTEEVNRVCEKLIPHDEP